MMSLGSFSVSVFSLDCLIWMSGNLVNDSNQYVKLRKNTVLGQTEAVSGLVEGSTQTACNEDFSNWHWFHNEVAP
jgi:hypothetical protein